ncbi:hypothetical protein JCM17823_14360 [Halorubrum gandharaense]
MTNRREFLATTGSIGATVATAGCFSPNTESEQSEPDAENETEEERAPSVEITESWTFEAENTFNSTPIIRDEVVYVYNDDRRLYAIELTSGEVLWDFQFDSLSGSIYPPAIGEDYVFTRADSDGFSVYALDKSDGSVVWEQEDLRRAHTVTDNGLFTARGGIKSIDIETGEINWEYSASSYGTPPVASGTKIIGIGGSEIYAVDQLDGEEIWHEQAPGDIKSDSLHILDDVVVFSADDERIHFLDIEDGETKQQVETDGTAEVAVVEEDLYYQDGEGLHLYDLSDGEEIWTTTDRPAARGEIPNQYSNGELITVSSVSGAAHVNRDNGAVYELFDVELPPNVGHSATEDCVIIPDGSRSLNAFVVEKE